MQFTFNEGHIQLPSQWQDQSMQVLVSTDNSGINLVITREAVPQGTLTPELYQERWRCTRANLMGTPNMPAGKSLWQRPRPGCWIIPGTVRKMRGIRGGLAR